MDHYFLIFLDFVFQIIVFFSTVTGIEIQRDCRNYPDTKTIEFLVEVPTNEKETIRFRYVVDHSINVSIR
ncbi:hypothetical protein [Virgibacillus byunsanensis]|uniref:hypothetical protein n=1 Tax=Virgibacillus byunsanensis TaxID=570945 RepID=UPI0036F415BC